MGFLLPDLLGRLDDLDYPPKVKSQLQAAYQSGGIDFLAVVSKTRQAGLKTNLTTTGAFSFNEKFMEAVNSRPPI